jgi:hypothetical protein
MTINIDLDFPIFDGLTDEESRGSFLGIRPSHFTAKRKTVRERAEHIPEHVLDLAGLLDQVANRQRIGVSQRNNRHEVNESQTEPDLPLERSENGSVSRGL